MPNLRHWNRIIWTLNQACHRVLYQVCQSCMYINDIVTVSNKFKFMMYADETIIYFNLEAFSGINVEENVSMN